MILHVYTFGTLRLDCVDGDAMSNLIVDEDLRGGLRIAEIGEGFTTQPSGHLSGMECCRIFCFTDRGHYILNH
jgi:hypothetical protein